MEKIALDGSARRRNQNRVKPRKKLFAVDSLHEYLKHVKGLQYFLYELGGSQCMLRCLTLRTCTFVLNVYGYIILQGFFKINSFEKERMM